MDWEQTKMCRQTRQFMLRWAAGINEVDHIYNEILGITTTTILLIVDRYNTSCVAITKPSINWYCHRFLPRTNCWLLLKCIYWHQCSATIVYYSSTCHGRPPLVQRKSGPSWQVAPRDRERTYAPLCQIKHTHQTAYFTAHAQHYIDYSGQLQCCLGLKWEMKRTMLKMCEKINSIYPQCNAYRWTHTCAVLYYVAVIAADLKWAMAIDRFSRDNIQHSAVRWPR